MALTAILRALRDLGDARLWGVALKAVVVTLVLLGLAFWAGGWALGVGEGLGVALPWSEGFTAPGGLTIALWIAGALVVSTFLTPPVAALFVGLLLDDVVDAVEARRYPDAPPAAAVPVLRQMGAALNLLALMLLANGFGLLVWLLAAPVAPFYFIATNGYLIGREYFELVASRRMSPDAARKERRRLRLSVWAIGAATAAALTVPIVNLLAPLLGVAAATHLHHAASRPGGGGRRP